MNIFRKFWNAVVEILDEDDERDPVQRRGPPTEAPIWVARRRHPVALLRDGRGIGPSRRRRFGVAPITFPDMGPLWYVDDEAERAGVRALVTRARNV